MINLTNGVVKKNKKVKFNPVAETMIFSNKTSPSIIRLQTPIKIILEREPVKDFYESLREDDFFDFKYSYEDVFMENLRRLKKLGLDLEQIQNRLNELDKINEKWQNYKYDYYSKHQLN